MRLGATIAEDSLAKHLAAYTGVSEANVQLWQPVMLPAWLDLSGLVLITYGLGRPPKRQSAKPARKATRKREKPAKRTAKVLPFARVVP